MLTLRCGLLLLLLGPAPAAASPRTFAGAEGGSGSESPQLGLFLGVGTLTSPGGDGGALAAGLRLGLASHVALSLDLGYGVMSVLPGVEDRWWIMPAAALSFPSGGSRFDLGVGLGLAASSGYASWASYAAAPFTPDWAFQLVPAARAHAVIAIALGERYELFGRLDVGALILEGTTFGFRVGNLGHPLADTLWISLSIGVQFRLL